MPKVQQPSVLTPFDRAALAKCPADWRDLADVSREIVGSTSSVRETMTRLENCRAIETRMQGSPPRVQIRKASQ